LVAKGPPHKKNGDLPQVAASNNPKLITDFLGTQVLGANACARRGFVLPENREKGNGVGLHNRLQKLKSPCPPLPGSKAPLR
jgi:hypothetical protein